MVTQKKIIIGGALLLSSIIMYKLWTLLNEKPTETYILKPINPETHVFAFDLHGVVFSRNYTEMFEHLKKAPITARSLLTLLNPLFIFELVTLLCTRDSVEEMIMVLSDRFPTLKCYKNTAIEMTNSQSPVKGTVAIIKELKAKGYKLYVFSNIGIKSFEQLQSKFPAIFAHFQGAIVTQPEDNWIQKPHPKACQKLINTLGVSPENIIFIDDKKANITAAQAMGIQGIQFHSPQQLMSALNGLIEPHTAPNLGN